MAGKTWLNAASETLDKIMGSSFSKNVMTTMEEVNENMADLVRRNKLKRVPLIGSAIDGGVNDETLGKLGEVAAKAGAGGKVDESLFSQFDKMVADMADEAAAGAGKEAVEELSGKNVRSRIGAINYFANLPSAYLNVEDKAVKNDRIKALVGGYAGIAIGGRIIQGGSITRDQYGQNDIAGIPFI